jgi:hypothetical protein
MLNRTSARSWPRMEFATLTDGSAVRSADGTLCQYCGCNLRPHDIEISGNGLRWFCWNCHRDILIVEPRP